MPKRKDLVTVAVPVGLPVVPVTVLVANGIPLSVKVTVPPTGLPAVQLTMAVNVTGWNGNGVVVDAASVVVEVTAEPTVTVVLPVDGWQKKSPLYAAVMLCAPTGAVKVALIVAVPVGVVVTTGAEPRKAGTVVSKNETDPLGLPGGAPKQRTTAVSVDVPPTGTVAGEAVTVVSVGRNGCLCAGWAVAGDANAVMPASTTAPAATRVTNHFIENLTTALHVVCAGSRLLGIPVA